MLKHISFYLNLAALALFFPGILLPMFSLNMDVTAGVGVSRLTTDIVNKELSLLATIEELWQDQRLLVAALIGFFSICIPLLKSLLLAIAYIKRESKLEQRLINFVATIGKWSMADVFVVAVFLAVLSTNHAETASHHQLVLFGFKVNVQMSSETLSMVGAGFYYFTAYCLLSLLASQLAQLTLKPVKSAELAQQTSVSEL